VKKLNICNYLMAAILIISGCSAVKYNEDPGKYEKEIDRLSAQLENNPADPMALKDLGIILFKTADYTRALALLQRADQKLNKDAEQILYLGLSYEFNNKIESAVEVYSRYRNISRTSQYRSKIEGRYHWLARQQMRQQMRKLILTEEHLSIQSIPPNTVAVFPFLLLQGKNNYSSIGLGLAEMITTDLSQVRRINMIERNQIQALFEEIAVGQTGIIEERTAPRFGKLLGAEKIIHGSFSIASGERIQLDAAMWDIKKQRFPKYSKTDDDLKNLFALEKEIVFDLINQMGIKLTQAEKDQIQRIPTKNMQAFMAYCQGLELQDSGNFDAANKQFEAALKLDPAFEPAKAEAQKTGDLSVSRGSKEDFINIANPPLIWSIDTEDLVNNRLRILNLNTGSNFIQGEDSRRPGEEASNSGVDIGLGELADPPNPPDN